MRHSLPDLAVWAGDRREPSSTSIAGVGAYVVVVASALPDRPVTLTSCFLGQVDSDTAVSHLRLAPDHQRHGPLGRCR